MKCKDCKYYTRNPIYKIYEKGWCDLLTNLKVDGDEDVNCEYFAEKELKT